MRRIFVPLQAPDDVMALLPLAGHLAARLGAQIEAALITDAVRRDDEMLTGADRAVADTAAGTRAIFPRWADALAPEGVPLVAGWREIPDGVVYASASLGRASDLIVTHGSGDRRFRDALLASGRPTLLAASFRNGVPAPLESPLSYSGLLDHVVVAWDGSAGAVRALGASLGLLARAGSIRLIIIGRNTVGMQARGEILSYMALHNQQVRLVVQDNAHRQTGRALLEAIREEPASLVIMGVCGRSHPPGSSALGGTILKMVEHGRIPILTAS